MSKRRIVTLISVTVISIAVVAVGVLLYFAHPKEPPSDSELRGAAAAVIHELSAYESLIFGIEPTTSGFDSTTFTIGREAQLSLQEFKQRMTPAEPQGERTNITASSISLDETTVLDGPEDFPLVRMTFHYKRLIPAGKDQTITWEELLETEANLDLESTTVTQLLIKDQTFYDELKSQR